jgi:L-threonylcarbamoyladenylate synthase
MNEENSPTDRSFDDSVQHQLHPRGEHSVILQRGSPHAIEWAAEQLAAGGVIGLPTDTVYGIAASLGHADAIARIFEIKQRPLDRPLPVLVSSTRSLLQFAQIRNKSIRDLLDEFWPGPLTIVVHGARGLPAGVRGEDGTVAVRLPNHPLAIEIIEKAGGAVACTSANASGEAPATTALEVVSSLDGKLDLVIDGGRAPGGVASTVVMAVDDELRVLREGGLSSETVQSAWQSIRTGGSS